MKRVCFLIIIIFCICSTLPAHAVKFGVKGGLNLSKASFNPEVLEQDNFTGFQLGPIIEFDLSPTGFAMDLAVLYSQEGFKINSHSQKTNSIDIPLNLKYKLGLLGTICA